MSTQHGVLDFTKHSINPVTDQLLKPNGPVQHANRRHEDVPVR